MKIKVGIFFGGTSREREISFAGGRTVYDNLNKALYEPVPIFVDSLRNFILLDWQYIYKGSIRDFYPPVDMLPPSPNNFQIYVESLGQLSAPTQEALIAKIGRKLQPSELSKLIDLAFLALHGEYGEDGQLQRELEALRIPYTGSGVSPSQLGMDKAVQKAMMPQYGFASPPIMVLDREVWKQARVEEMYNRAIQTVGFPIVIRPANQGSSIGVSIVEEEGGLEEFENAVNGAFFREIIPASEWTDREAFERVEYVRMITDIRDGLGFPMLVTTPQEQKVIYHPEALLQYLDSTAEVLQQEGGAYILESHDDESQVLIEAFIHGKEFSCIVIRKEDNSAVALPPTEIVKGSEVYDYRSKYLPGLSRKITPIDLAESDINAIRAECERLFHTLGFHVYARIDGFIKADGSIILNDPNTTSGMLPSSFFFHQAAEIGLNPSQFLTYIIRASLQERLAEQPGQDSFRKLMERLDEQILTLRATATQRKRIAVIMGGYSFERHISVESGRNIFEKLASSDKYEPIPVFLSGDEKNYELWQIPINLMLKDNADDIRDKILHWKLHPVVEAIKVQCAEITGKYASRDVVFAPQRLSFDDLKQSVDGVFVALHGRPGEDGQVQMQLDAKGIPYNGSGVRSSSITIDKFRTLQTLKKNGFPIAQQLLVKKTEYEANSQDFFNRIETMFGYPMVAKPVDDGCSSAVKVIDHRAELEAYTRLIFRPEGQEGEEARRVLHLKQKEEFPRKQEILFESLVKANGASHFLEVTGGLLTHFNADSTLRYEVFEPSETLASGEVLSLEEKFLAGEGQNITPARFSNDPKRYETIAAQVKASLEKAARILDIQGYARIDAFVRIYEDDRAETVVIEANSLPGMTPATCIFHQAAINGYKPYEFIDRILEFGFEKKLRESGKPVIPVAATQAPTDSIPEQWLTSVQEAPMAGPVEQPESELQPQSAADGNLSLPQYDPLPQKPPTWENITYGIRTMAGNAAAFLGSAPFLTNLLAMVVFIGGILLVVTLGLNWYTRHGESLQVPNYIGMDLREATRKAKSMSFSIVIIDSIFDPDKRAYEIFQQDPKPFSRVKENRTVYLSMYSSTPPEVTLPSLVGNYDFYQYEKKLRSMKIRAEIKERQFDSKQQENTILHFFYNDRKITDEDLRQGVKIPQGSVLQFVVSVRHTGMVPIPDMVCKTYEEAVFLISSMNLNIGTIYGEVADRSTAYIWKQEPAYLPDQMLRMGEQVSLYLVQERPADCPTEEAPPAPPVEDGTDFN
jgi:D-alanine-D-alanine ligase